MVATLREARIDDVPDLLRMVKDLATYEKQLDSVVATEEKYAKVLFPEDGNPGAFALVAEAGGRVVGMAIWHLTFSTWNGTNGIWLEDLYVEPEFQGRGVGVAFLAALANICEERGYQRLEWWVLEWNTPAIDFYTAMGSTPMSEWQVHRIDGAELDELAHRSRRTGHDPQSGAS